MWPRKATWSKGHTTLWVGAYQGKFGDHGHSGSGDNFSLSRDLLKLLYQSVIWLCGRKSLMVIYHNAKFGVNGYCSSGDINISANWLILPQMREITPQWNHGLQAFYSWLTLKFVIIRRGLSQGGWYFKLKSQIGGRGHNELKWVVFS